MCEMAEEALRPARSGSRPAGRSATSSRTVVPSRAPGPGPTSCWRSATCSGAPGEGLFEGAMRLGERDDEALTQDPRRGRRDGRHQPPLRPAGQLRPGAVEPPARPLRPGHRLHQGSRTRKGAMVRPQTTARGIGILFGLFNRTPWDRTPAFRDLHELAPAERLAAIRDPQWRARLIADGADARLMLGPDMIFVLPDGPARYDCRHEDSLAAHAARRGVSPVEAFLDLADRERRHGQPQHAAAQPAARRGRGDARRRAGHPRPRRRRRPRRPDHGHQPADVPADVLGARAPALDARGGRAPADVRHRRPVRLHRPRRAARRRLRRRQRDRPRATSRLPQPEFVQRPAQRRRPLHPGLQRLRLHDRQRRGLHGPRRPQPAPSPGASCARRPDDGSAAERDRARRGSPKRVASGVRARQRATTSTSGSRPSSSAHVRNPR